MEKRLWREKEIGKGHPTLKTEDRLLRFAHLQTVRGTSQRIKGSGEGDRNHSKFGVKISKTDLLGVSQTFPQTDGDSPRAAQYSVLTPQTWTTFASPTDSDLEDRRPPL